mgnify:CR=1 FL=1
MHVLLLQFSLEPEITLVPLRKTLPLNHWISAAIPLHFPSIPTPVTEQRNARMLPLHMETNTCAGTDFTVSYKDNVKEGTAAVTITGTGNYTGIINTAFTITAAPGKDDSGKNNSSKNDSDKGNQNSSMKKAKTLTVKGSATHATLKKLVSKKKYYVRIRTYKVVSGKKYYSKWSSKKSVKIK